MFLESTEEFPVNMRFFMTLFFPAAGCLNIRTCTEPSAAHSIRQPVHVTGVSDLRIGIRVRGLCPTQGLR